MFRNYRWLMLAAALVTGLCARTSSAQDGPILLADVLRDVTAANPTLEAARLAAEALTFRGEQVSARPDPTFGVKYQPYPMLTAHGAQRSQWTLEQMIPYPGKLGLQEEIADIGARRAEYEVASLADDLIVRAKEAYYELYRLQELEALISGFQDDLSRFEEAAAVRYEVGQGMQQAVLKAQLEKNQLTRHLIDLQVRRRSAAETLARLTNDAQGVRRYQTAELVPPPLPDVDRAALVRVSMEQRAEVAALDAAAEQAERQVDLARMQYRPDFGLNFTYFDIASRDAPATAGGRDAVSVGVSIKFPLQRGRVRAQIAEAEIRRREIAARREALETDIRTRIQDLLFNLEQEQETLDLYERVLLPQAASTVEAALSAYTSGRTGYLELLDAQRGVFDLRTGLEDARLRYLTTAARLERVLGIDSLDQLERLISHSQVTR